MQGKRKPNIVSIENNLRIRFVGSWKIEFFTGFLEDSDRKGKYQKEDQKNAQGKQNRNFFERIKANWRLIYGCLNN
jgi:hypothetical protein